MRADAPSERPGGTGQSALQDRLVKEMRRRICSIEAAEEFFQKFISKYNDKFAVNPQATEDAHRPLDLDAAALEETLTQREERVLTKALTFSCGGVKYAVKTKGPGQGAGLCAARGQDHAAASG